MHPAVSSHTPSGCSLNADTLRRNRAAAPFERRAQRKSTKILPFAPEHRRSTNGVD
jgi:hypothetical protein